jgi:hypothetical protein
MKNSKLKIEGFLNNKITGSQMKAIYGGDGDIIMEEQEAVLCQAVTRQLVRYQHQVHL